MLKRLVSIAFLLIIGSQVFASVTAAPAKFGGIWSLVRSKSEGLTGTLAGADIILYVDQDLKNISVDQKIRIRGHEQPSQPLIYSLEGKDTTAEVVRPMAGTMTLQARWIEKGQVLELKSSISGMNLGKLTGVVTKEYWELVDDGKGLKITRTRETPEKTQQFKLYFEKKG